MGVEVWPYHRADCDRPGCGWEGPLHLSPVSAGDDAATHEAEHHEADQAAVDAFRGELGRL